MTERHPHAWHFIVLFQAATLLFNVGVLGWMVYRHDWDGIGPQSLVVAILTVAPFVFVNYSYRESIKIETYQAERETAVLMFEKFKEAADNGAIGVELRPDLHGRQGKTH
jgi:hypothetical protein